MPNIICIYIYIYIHIIISNKTIVVFVFVNIMIVFSLLGVSGILQRYEMKNIRKRNGGEVLGAQMPEKCLLAVL